MHTFEQSCSKNISLSLSLSVRGIGRNISAKRITAQDMICPSNSRFFLFGSWNYVSLHSLCCPKQCIIINFCPNSSYHNAVQDGKTKCCLCTANCNLPTSNDKCRQTPLDTASKLIIDSRFLSTRGQYECYLSSLSQRISTSMQEQAH